MFTSLWHNPADENQSVSDVYSINNNKKKRLVIRDVLKPIALYSNVQINKTITSDKDEDVEHDHKKARTR
jgi:hypothetical protein